MYTVILNTGKHFLKKKMWLLPTAKKKKKENHMDFYFMKNSVIILGILVRNYKSISVPHYTEQKLCQCHMELYS